MKVKKMLKKTLKDKSIKNMKLNILKQLSKNIVKNGKKLILNCCFLLKILKNLYKQITYKILIFK